MAEILSLIFFWGALVLLAYVYVGFPVIVALAGRLFPRTVRKRPMTPPVSLIIAAYNEEDAIAGRLENALELDYPETELQIIVASDGSTDATEQIAEGFASRGVCVLPLPRRGKIHALADAVRHATGEILVFSDANTIYDRNALRALAQNFADPEVGGVAGHTSYALRRGSESSSEGENLYWNYDTWLKQMESLTGSVVSAHGGMYAIRREFFPAITDAAVTDDFFISTAVIEGGRRLVFESRARGWEGTVEEAHREFWRRVRLDDPRVSQCPAAQAPAQSLPIGLLLAGVVHAQGAAPPHGTGTDGALCQFATAQLHRETLCRCGCRAGSVLRSRVRWISV